MSNTTRQPEFEQVQHELDHRVWAVDSATQKTAFNPRVLRIRQREILETGPVPAPNEIEDQIPEAIMPTTEDGIENNGIAFPSQAVTPEVATPPDMSDAQILDIADAQASVAEALRDKAA